MNYKLSCSMSDKKGRVCYVLFLDGKELSYRVDNLSCLGRPKADILNCITRGLRDVSSRIHHEDFLNIELSNRYILGWLSGEKDSKGYEQELDELFSVLESLDCRYKFIHSTIPSARYYLEIRDVNKINAESIGDIMKEFK